ncbi:MAG: ATP-dependent Clp protease ATP-binding subunit, partial [Flavobacteriales bacterium]
ASLGLSLKVSTEAKDYIENKGFDSEYGARPLKRAIQKYLEDAVAEEIIKSNLKEGDSIQVDFDKEKNEITLKITKPKNPKKKTKEEPEQEGE